MKQLIAMAALVISDGAFAAHVTPSAPSQVGMFIAALGFIALFGIRKK